MCTPRRTSNSRHKGDSVRGMIIVVSAILTAKPQKREDEKKKVRKKKKKRKKKEKKMSSELANAGEIFYSSLLKSQQIKTCHTEGKRRGCLWRERCGSPSDIRSNPGPFSLASLSQRHWASLAASHHPRSAKRRHKLFSIEHLG